MGYWITLALFALVFLTPSVGVVDSQWPTSQQASIAAVSDLPMMAPGAQVETGLCGENGTAGTSRTSFNVNAEKISDRTYFLDVMQRLRPPWVLLMSDWSLSLAHDVIRVTGGQTKVIERFPDGAEATHWRQGDQFISNVLDSWSTLPDATNPNIFFHVLLKPSLSDEDVPGIADWLVRFMNEADRRGLKLVVGNFAVGTWQMSQIEGGLFDNLLRALAASRGRHYLGLHEYAGPSMPNSVNYPFDWMTQTDKVQPAWWPTKGQLAIQSSGLPPYWLLLRGTWFVIRSRELGLGDIDLIVTEWGWDRIPLLETEGIYSDLEGRYGWPPPHITMRGLDTLQYVWRAWWPYWSFEQAAFEQIKWAENIYPDFYKGMMLYTWSYDEQWDGWYGFNVAPYRALHEMIVQSAHSPESQPLVTPPPATPLYGPPLPTPIPPSVFQMQVAEQRFEHGRMIWIQPRGQIWVLVDDDASGTRGKWRVYSDTFVEGEAESDPRIVAPPGFYQPTRGFGKLWRSFPLLRQSLGWARDPEFGHITCYEYHVGLTADTENPSTPMPGFHTIQSRWGERLLFNEADNTWMALPQ